MEQEDEAGHCEGKTTFLSTWYQHVGYRPGMLCCTVTVNCRFRWRRLQTMRSIVVNKVI